MILIVDVTVHGVAFHFPSLPIHQLLILNVILMESFTRRNRDYVFRGAFLALRLKLGLTQAGSALGISRRAPGQVQP